jgi:hypothetical protein
MSTAIKRRHFALPWTADETDACFIVRDHNRMAVAYVYFEDEPGRRTAANLPTRDEARRMAVLFLIDRQRLCKPEWNREQNAAGVVSYLQKCPRGVGISTVRHKLFHEQIREAAGRFPVRQMCPTHIRILLIISPDGELVYGHDGRFMRSAIVSSVTCGTSDRVHRFQINQCRTRQGTDGYRFSEKIMLNQ